MQTETKDKATSDFASEFLALTNDDVLMLNPMYLTDFKAVKRFAELINKAYLLKEE